MAARKKVVLHIGAGKTGSSAIQSALARNQDMLRSAGIAYPDHAALESARRGETTSGNLDPENWFEGQVVPAARAEQDCATILFSNENLFYRFDEFLAAHAAYADEFDFEIILFVREPFEKLNSAYQQLVKRKGYAGTLGEFADHDADTQRAADLLLALQAARVPFKLFNYSALRGSAVPAFFEHFGVSDRIDAEIGTVNRSLTAAELVFLRGVNQLFGAEYGSVIADALIHRLPGLAADMAPIDADSAARFHAANADAVVTINAFLPPTERLRFDLTHVPLEMGAAAPALSDAQVAVIRSVFPSALTYPDGIVLRDIAMKYESGEKLTREDAIALIQFAQKARPHGRIIAGKLKQWRDS
jgi:hypothetical protein